MHRVCDAFKISKATIAGLKKILHRQDYLQVFWLIRSLTWCSNVGTAGYKGHPQLQGLQLERQWTVRLKTFTVEMGCSVYSTVKATTAVANGSVIYTVSVVQSWHNYVHNIVRNCKLPHRNRHTFDNRWLANSSVILQQKEKKYLQFMFFLFFFSIKTPDWMSGGFRENRRSCNPSQACRRIHQVACPASIPEAVFETSKGQTLLKTYQ